MLDEVELLILFGKIVAEHEAVVENLSYVIGELPHLRDSRLKENTQNVCEVMTAKINRCCNNLKYSAISYKHSPSLLYANAIGEEARRFLECFQLELIKVDALVGDLQDSDDQLLAVLVSESMANVLKIFCSLKMSLDELQHLCSTEQKLSGESPTLQTGPVHFSCDFCGDRVLTISTAIDKKGKGILLKNFDTEYGFDASSIEQLSEALRQNSALLFERFTGEDLFCKKCQKFYCKSHWTNVIPHYDEAGYDYTTALCPSGHKSIIDD